MIIYSTAPVMKVVGEAKVEEILEDVPEKIWNITKNDSGISENFFEEYYKNKETAVAYKLNDIIKYKEPRELKDYGIKNAPQSFIYLN